VLSDDTAVSGVPERAEDDTVIKKHSAEAVYCALKILWHATCTEAEEAQQDEAHQLILIAKPWIIWRCSELKLANAEPHVQSFTPN